MLKLYEYLFYKYYTWSIRLTGGSGNHRMNASLMMSVAFLLYVIGAALLVLSSLFSERIRDLAIPKDIQGILPICFVIVGVGSVMANYVFFEHRCERILSTFKDNRVRAGISEFALPLTCSGGAVLLFVLGLAYAFHVRNLP
jgi:hypothetical protein